MTRVELSEAVAALEAIVTALLQTVSEPAGVTGAKLRQACGALSANAGTLIAGAKLGAPLLAAFRAAWSAGATLDGMARVRHTAQAQSAVHRAAIAVTQGAIRLSLHVEARIVAATRFTSREEVDRIAARMNCAFDTAEDQAAGAMAQDAWRALTALHAAVTYDLVSRARPLPQIVRYDFAQRKPALCIAQRLYADAGRTTEIISENRAAHPLFMPRAGRALSA